MNGILLHNFQPKIAVTRDKQGRITQGLVIGETTRQNQAIILSAHQGEIREKPLLGVGIGDMLFDSDPLYWRVRIREHLERDGQRVASIKITKTGLTIDSEY